MRIRTLKAGFTLIELLVVIAIIGLLASVVLASLNSARDKGATASIKANINNARVQAELYYDNNQNSYGTSAWQGSGNPSGTGICSVGSATNPTVYSMVNAANVANGDGSVSCNSNGTAWAIQAQLLPATPVQYYCVDSTGVGVTGSSAKPTSGTQSVVCPSS